MGQHKNAAINARSQAAQKRANKYAGSNQAASSGTPIGWDEVDAVTVAAFVAAVTNAGDAVILGRTSDGGALSVCILSGDTKHREYLSDPDAAVEALKRLAVLAAV